MNIRDFAVYIAAEIRRLLDLNLIRSVNCRVLPAVHILEACQRGDMDTVEQLVLECGPHASEKIPPDHQCWNNLAPHDCLCRKAAEYFRAQQGEDKPERKTSSSSVGIAIPFLSVVGTLIAIAWSCCL